MAPPLSNGVPSGGSPGTFFSVWILSLGFAFRHFEFALS
jgi:hypothetical protein